MKKIVTASLVAALALTSANASSLSERLSSLEAELADVKKKLKSQNTKINKVKAHDANDNIKWGADLRTAIDNINYDMADGSTQGKDDLMSLRLWLNMAYAPDSHNIFKGQLSMHKAFGAEFSMPGRGWGMDNFDWVTNEALTNDNLRVRQAYWLYLGDKAFGLDMPWTFSVGRRPSTNGFLVNLRDDDDAQSPLSHIVNVEFDGLSSKIDLSNITGVTGMTLKFCAGQGGTNAAARFTTPTDYADVEGEVSDIAMAGFIFEPYNDGQFITKVNWFKAFDLPDMVNPMDPSQGMENVGDIQGAAFSVLIDGLADDGFLADTKLFGSFAWSETDPFTGKSMLGSTESESGTSYWLGAQIPVTEDGKFGVEYNHGSQYWRPFTYGEDTIVGSKLAARGNAYEAYFTYQLTDALSAQVRYTSIEYDYTGSNGFFGSTTGTSMKIDDVKDGAAGYDQLVSTIGTTDPAVLAGAMVAGGMAPDIATANQMVSGMAMAKAFLPNIVEAAQDFRFYLRYRF